MNLYTYRLQQGDRVKSGAVLGSSPASAASRALSLQDIDLKDDEEFELTMSFSGRAAQCPHGKSYIEALKLDCIRCASAANLAKPVQGVRDPAEPEKEEVYCQQCFTTPVDPAQDGRFCSDSCEQQYDRELTAPDSVEEEDD